MHFAASFPHLVCSVALLAPVGLLKCLPTTYEELKQAAQAGRDESEIRARVGRALDINFHEPKTQPSGSVVTRMGFDPAVLVRWQFEKHEGHVASFASHVQHSPLQEQHEVWREACAVLKGKYDVADGRSRHSRKEKLVVVCGRDDDIVLEVDVRESLNMLTGKEHFILETVEAGHGFLVDGAACEKIVGVLAQQWQL